jgi:mercuric ion binding protein
MRSFIPRSLLAAAILAATSLAAAAARAESKVTLTDVHICCPACAKAIDKAVAKSKTAKATIDKDAGTVALTAPDDKSLQKAVNQIAKAGFHGMIDKESKVQFKKQEIPKGKVQRLEVKHIHNCCGQCVKAIKAAVAEVEGVKGDSLKEKETKFVIEGDFEAAKAIEALEKAGFHASLTDPKAAKKPAVKKS